VLARRKSTAEAQRLARASVWVSVCGIVVGIVILFLFVPILRGTGSWCGTLESEDDGNDTDTHYWRKPTTPRAPEVTSSAWWCHVVEDDSACFRFASSLTAEWCSQIDGVVVNVSSLRSSALPPTLAATAVSVICYHNVCANGYVVDTSCFQYRSAFWCKQFNSIPNLYSAVR